MKMFLLQTQMFMLVAVLFAILYAVIVVAGQAMGVGNFYFYLMIALGMMFVQYLIGPWLVGLTMRVKYIKREEMPWLFDMVQEQAERSGVGMPKVCISQMNIPNAFAFGRGFGDGRVCVSEGIINLLDRRELKAVIGHEMTHLKNNDVLTITLLSVIPMILYRVAWHFMWFGGDRRDRGNGALIGVAAFIFYFITNLLVLYGSRIREYFADRGSVENGNDPAALASALYKLVYGSARINKAELKEVEGIKAFFINDPSRAITDIRELAELDRDKSGTIDPHELAAIRNMNLKLNFGDKMMEILSTHPNMLKRIKHLSSL